MLIAMCSRLIQRECTHQLEANGAGAAADWTQSTKVPCQSISFANRAMHRQLHELLDTKQHEGMHTEFVRSCAIPQKLLICQRLSECLCS